MATLSLPGLSTGIDTAAIVRQLVQASQGTLRLLQARQSQVQGKNSALATVESRMRLVRTAAEDLRSAADLRAYKVTTGDSAVVTASATSAASEGAHEILIDRLAAAERKVHQGLADDETLVGEGTFVYTYDGEQRVIQTTASTTLAGLRDLINNDGGNPGVNASLLEYDAGGGQVFHLVLGGTDTGADHTIAIDDEQTTLAAFQSGTFTTTQAAQNSRVRIDGYPAGAWIERSGNTLDDVLPGVTLSLHATTTEAVRVSLTRDTAGLKAKLQALVTSYNDLVDYAQKQVAYDEATKKAGSLMGEYTMTHLLQQVRLPIIERAAGFVSGQDAYSLAAEVGLSVDRYGKLKLDEKVLDKGLSDDYLGVLALLGADRTGASDSASLRFYAARSVTVPGTYAVKATFTDGVLTAAWMKKASEPDSAYRAAAIDGNLILGASGRPEHNLQVTGSYAGSGTVVAEVRVRQGVGGRLYDLIDDSLTDVIDRTQDRFQDEIDRYTDRISTETDRLLRMEVALTARFARLEAALIQLQAQSSALQSLNR